MQIRNLSLLKEKLLVSEQAIVNAICDDEAEKATRVAYAAYMAYYDELDKQRK